LKARDPKKNKYVMKGQEVVGVTMKQKQSPHGTATLLRCALAPAVKSLSKKCLLQKYLLCPILAESLMQDIPTFPAHTRAL
jgi:hypothetical protein